MIGRTDLIKKVAERSGISPEISNYFFEVFINRLSSRLKTGEVLQFSDDGYFQKRNCRVAVEKSADKPTGGSLLVTLILFSSEPEIVIEPKEFYFFKVTDLKTLWEDDQDFLYSIDAGDFSPYLNRSQLINSFATKAEVIISGLNKHYSVFEEELIIPFSLNFSSKDSTESKLLFDSHNLYGQKANGKVSDKKAGDSESPDEEPKDSTLPWSFGKKFYDKKTDQPSAKDVKKKNEADLEKESDSLSKIINKRIDSGKNIDAEDALDAAIEESDIEENISKFREFQPVKSRLAADERNKLTSEEQAKLRSHKADIPPQNLAGGISKNVQKFTEVKSKTETYHLQNDIKKLKKKNKIPDVPLSRTPEFGKSYREFSNNRNLIPVIMILAVILIAVAVVYIYFIKDNDEEIIPEKMIVTVSPPPNVKIIERDYELAVTYPYPKVENEIPIEGINPDVFSTQKITEEKPVKTEQKPVIEKKEETKTEVKPITVPEVKEEKKSRIFLFNSYYVVYMGTYSSYASADREAEKFFDEGYNAFIETEEIPGKPTKYKLNVGDFTSEQFAREFESKYFK